jgi:hypothetical protein
MRLFLKQAEIPHVNERKQRRICRKTNKERKGRNKQWKAERKKNNKTADGGLVFFRLLNLYS